MPPQWTQPLNIATLCPPPPTSDSDARRHHPVRDVPSSRSPARLRAAERRFLRNAHRPLFPRKPAARSPILRLNRLHPPLPDLLSAYSPPVRAEFLRVSAVASTKYTTPPDPADDHDNSLFEFPSVLAHHHHPRHAPVHEPRRRNIQALIDRYNHPVTPPSPAATPPDHPHFNIRSVRDIFERHAHTELDLSLSSVTTSATPEASHAHLPGGGVPDLHTPEHRPRRIAFADLANTLDLSPCASSISDADRDVPIVTPPNTTIFPHDAPSVTPKKSFAGFRRRAREIGRVESFASAEVLPSRERATGRRSTNAERPRKKWVSRRVRAYGGVVRRTFESLRNMVSAQDY